jgi:hypothetical protein
MKKTTRYGIEKMYLLYIFFNPSKKNSFGCPANRKIGNRKIQRHISIPT